MGAGCGVGVGWVWGGWGVGRVCVLPDIARPLSMQPYSLCRMGDFAVLRPARRIHIQPRGRVLAKSPHPASVRSAKGIERGRPWPPRVFVVAQGEVPRGLSRLAVRGGPVSFPFRAVTLPASSHAIPGAILGRRDTASVVSLGSRGAYAEPSPVPSLNSTRAHPAPLLTSSAESRFRLGAQSRSRASHHRRTGRLTGGVGVLAYARAEFRFRFGAQSRLRAEAPPAHGL